ncbi:MAG: hypothetical protein K9J06_01445 [Flavobacteriales bacterium]|nr:hypothetical protein [Flavobacteriales bacterium]
MQSNSRHWWTLPATVAACALLALSVASQREFHNLAMYGLLHADAQGYYGYLVAIFIEHSFHWEQVMAGYRDTYFGGGGADFTVVTEFGRVNKYYAGTAVLMLPFFLLSCAAAWATGSPVDGYSLPFQAGMMLSALTYVMAGLYLLGRFMQRKGIAWHAVAFSIFGCFAGTGVFFYTVFEPGMSHAYSFFLFCAFIFLADRAMTDVSRRALIPLAVVTGLVVLVRPTNAVIVASLPFIAGGWGPFKVFIRTLFDSRGALVAASLATLAVVSIQPLLYWLQVGKPFVWSYGEEGFNFLDPQIVNVLFSYQKGLFVYYPWTLLALFGLVPLFGADRKRALWLLAFLALAVYVVSSWWCWYYGASMGMRAMIDHLPFFILLMAHLLHALSGWTRAAVVMLGMLAVPHNLVQSYQYNKFILHWDSMDNDRYWQVFLRTDARLQGVFYRTEPVAPTAEMTESSYVAATDHEQLLPEWGTQGRNQERAFSGTFSCRMGADNPYGTTIGIPWKAMGPQGKRVLVATMMVWSEVEMPQLSFAYSFSAGERHYGHTYLPCGDQVIGQQTWTQVRTVAELPDAGSPEDVWVVYPYTTGSDVIHVDDIRYEIVTLRDAQ